MPEALRIGSVWLHSYITETHCQHCLITTLVAHLLSGINSINNKGFSKWQQAIALQAYICRCLSLVLELLVLRLNLAFMVFASYCSLQENSVNVIATKNSCRTLCDILSSRLLLLYRKSCIYVVPFIALVFPRNVTTTEAYVKCNYMNGGNATANLYSAISHKQQYDNYRILIEELIWIIMVLNAF